VRAIVTGAEGQLGAALRATCPEGVQILAAGRAALDLADAASITRFMAAHPAELVINAGAYTDVERAESEPGLARAVNATAAGTIAQSCARNGARMIQVSTDFVFDGATTRAYRPDDATAPLNVYGATKREGEELALRHAPGCLVLRTAWLHAAGQRNNFVATMLRAMRGGKPLRVVCDQIGAPTHAPDLARAIWRLAARGAGGILHFTGSGVASWYDFAVAIQEEAHALGLVVAPVPIEPIPSAEFPTRACRPGFSVLDTSLTSAVLGEKPPHWRVALREMLEASRHHA
jgi:dTDP-4-dehydrorhamnose reductase